MSDLRSLPVTGLRFFIDHGMIHDRKTGKHVTTDADTPFCDGIERCCELLNELASPPPRTFPLLFDNEWLKSKIATDPDIECEAGPSLDKLGVAQTRGLPEGWKMVPITPTRKMIDRGYAVRPTEECWRTMLEVAPEPPALGTAGAVEAERKVGTEQDAYNIGYDNPAKSSRDFEWRHLVDVNAYRCGQLDRQNLAPRNSDYRREDYDPETFERNPPKITTIAPSAALDQAEPDCAACHGDGYFPKNDLSGDVACTTCNGTGLSSAALDPATVDETAWLIETDEGGSINYFQLAHDDDWSFDANKALRFARREDAQAYIDHIGWTEPRPVEHMWCAPRSPVPSTSSTWQRIETAPKDGSRCDVWTVYYDAYQSRGERHVDAQYREQHSAWFDLYGNKLDWSELDESDDMKPRGRKTTHWMPLPTPPSPVPQTDKASLDQATVERCFQVALEERCQRGTPWDWACTTIARKIIGLIGQAERAPVDVPIGPSEPSYARGWYDMMAKAGDIAAAMGHQDVELKIRSVERRIGTVPQTNRGCEHVWQPMSIGSLICKCIKCGACDYGDNDLPRSETSNPRTSND